MLVSTMNRVQIRAAADSMIIGHAGWLGWPANLSPAAQLYAQVYNNASQPASLRGLATNVANYNGWSLSSCPSYTSGDSNCDEKKYINAMAPLLKTAGWDAHFITDTGERERLSWRLSNTE
jgi:cellulose 1,4-beta-cellobiosidase